MYMAKRFFDTDFFKKKFVRDLEPCYKLLWFYIMTDCNHAGIWEVDFEIANIRLKCDLNEEKSAEILKDKIVKVDNNEKWFIPSFIEFQYIELNKNNKAHLSVIQILDKYSILNLAPYKHLVSPLQGDKDKAMDKELDKDKDLIKELREEKHSFDESEFYDFEIFKDQFIMEKYANADMNYYYEAVKDWSANKGELSLDWIAVARSFMRRDTARKEFQEAGNGSLTPEEQAIEFEKRYYENKNTKL